jgi:hypothetical protein
VTNLTSFYDYIIANSRQDTGAGLIITRLADADWIDGFLAEQSSQPAEDPEPIVDVSALGRSEQPTCHFCMKEREPGEPCPHCGNPHEGHEETLQWALEHPELHEYCNSPGIKLQLKQEQKLQTA